MATINGTNGNNTLIGTSGNDTINGFGGHDNIYGQGGQDNIDGGSGDDNIDGGSGNDNIIGGSGNDDIEGGSENDIVHGGTGHDEIWGESGNDQLFGEDDDDEIDGGSGDDLIDGGNGDDWIDGDLGNDDIDGGAGNDQIYGGDNNDIVDGGSGNDEIQGGSGTDQLAGGDDHDEIDGGSGNDQIDGGNGNDVLYGGTGEDTIHGGAGIDIISGGDQNDTLYGEGGADLIDGGSGTDTAVYNASITEFSFYRLGPVFFVVHLGGAGSEGADALVNVEKVQFTDATIVTTGNNAPIAIDDSAATNEDAGSYSSGSASLLDNDFDVEGDTLTVTPATIAGTYGTLTINADGTYSYALNANAQTLAQGQVASDSFNYTVSDGSLTDTGTLTISVTGINDAPVANPDSAGTGENAVVFVDVLVNDNDVDNGAVLTVIAASAPPGQGVATIVGNQVRFDPGTDFDHLAQGATQVVLVNYTISDQFGATSSSTASITVTGTNDGPVANADAASTSENASVTVDVLVNDTDVDDGAVLTVTSASAPPGQGSASVVANQVQFDPGSDFDYLAVGQTVVVSVGYTISDEFGATSSSTIAITVTGTNDGPVANPDAASTSENASVTVDVLVNDSDPDSGAVLTVTSASAPPGQGSASVVANQVQFSPGTDFDYLAVGQSVVVNVGYTISDQFGATSSSTIAITVTGTNDGPVANPDAASTSENASVTVDVLVNDSDADSGAVLTVTSASAPPGQGSASVVANQVQFNPGSDFDYLAVGQSVVVNVGYTIQDEHGASASSTIAVTVTGTNDAPVIVAGGTTATGSVTELPNGDPGENIVVHEADGTIAFADVDLADTHSASFTPQGVGYYGTFTLDPVDQGGNDVDWHFDVSDAAIDGLEEGEVVVQTYAVQISDGNGGTATQNVTITITGAADNIPPDGTNWYIDNSAVGSLNTGSPSDPYTSIAAFNAAQGTPGGPGVGDNVFLLAGTGSYTEADGINLLDGQVLTGVASGPLRPTITALAGDGVNLGQNNSVSGLDIASTSGAGIADSGGSVGTLSIADVGKSGGGQIVDIDQGGTVNITLNSAVSTGSSGGAIDLNALAGSFTVTGATSITGATGGGVDVTSGVNLAASFQGGLLVSSGASTAVNFAGNAGASALSIAGGLSLTTTTGSGLQVQNGGSVTVTGLGNTIATNGGSAVIISHSTIGGAGVSLQSASSLGGSATGIILDTAGTGGFIVTGTGSVAGSGGTIANKVGPDGAGVTGNGIYINATSNVSFANMSITGNSNHGVQGSNVTGFTLTDSTLTGNGSSALEGGVVLSNLSGTSALLGNVIAGSAGDNVRIVNSAAAGSVTIADSANDQAIIGTNNNVTGGDGVHLETSGGASLTALVDGVDFQGARSDLLEVVALGNSTQDITINDSNFINLQNSVAGGGGVALRGGGTNSNINVDFAIQDSTFTGADGSAINASYTAAAGTIRGYIGGNTIGVDDGIAGSQGSSGGGDGITAGIDQSSGPGKVTYLLNIENNDIHDIAGGIGGIVLRSNGGGSGDGALLEATLADNVVDELGDFTLAALYALVGGTNFSGDFASMGLSLTNNVLDAGDADFGLNAILLDQLSSDAHFYFPGYAGSPDGEFMGGSASADLDPYLTGLGNVMTNGGGASFPGGGIDAGLVLGVTGDALVYPVYFP